MKKRLISLALVIVLVFSLGATAFAADASNTKSKEALKEVVTEVANSVGALGSGLVGLVDEAYVRDLIKGAISGLLDIGNLTSGVMSPILGNLIGGAIEGSLGFEIPDSVDIGGIINSIISNEIVNGILTSDFLATVIDKTIDNILDAMDLTEVTAIVIDLFFEEIIDSIVERVWNNGNPSVLYWTNGLGSWLPAGWITATLYVDLGLTSVGKLLGMFSDPENVNIDPMALLPSTDVLIDAVLKAIKDTTIEYYEKYKAQLIAAVKEKIEVVIADAIAAAKGFFINEINDIFGTNLTVNTTLADIEACIKAEIEKCTIEYNAVILNKLTAIKKLTYITCSKDILACINRLINCCNKQIGNCLMLTVDYGPCIGAFIEGFVVSQGNNVSAMFESDSVGNGIKISDLGFKLIKGNVTVKLIFTLGDGYLEQTKTWNGKTNLSYNIIVGSWDWMEE